jgi:hypothetical protein
MKDIIFPLVEKWEDIARRKFQCAENEKDNPMHRPTGRKFIEHGAMCYYNCAQELKAALSYLSPSSLTKREEDQKGR